MTKSKFMLLLIAISAAASSACRKNKSNPPQPTTYVKSITDADVSMAFGYDSQNRPVRMVKTENSYRLHN